MGLLDRIFGTGSSPAPTESKPTVVEEPPKQKPVLPVVTPTRSKETQDYGGAHVHAQPKTVAGAQVNGVYALNQQKNAGEMLRGVAKQKFCAGERFDVALTKQIEAIAGLPLSRSGLAEAYGACFPNATTTVDIGIRDDKTLDYKIRWFDKAGEEIGNATRIMRRHRDGSVELHRQGFWVQPKYRGYATAARGMKVEQELLKACSTHMNTRMTLRAGTAMGQKMGPYVWANFGFDFADQNKARSEIANYPDRDSTYILSGGSGTMSDLQLAQKIYPLWVDEMVKAGHIPNDSELVGPLKDAAKLWKHPWEIANFKIEGLRMPVTMGEVTMDCDVGKAYLLWERAPKWDGVFFVNRDGGDGNQIAAAYCERSIQGADAEQKQRDLELAKKLHSGDRASQKDALDQIGRIGGMDWMAPLKALSKKEPELITEVKVAMDRIAGSAS